jgi:DNA gyrase subunit A
MSDTTPPPDPPASDPSQVTFGSIEPIEIQTEMEMSFLDYAMSVIVSRALPDVRDGLKPVHRRILWAMHEAGLRPDRPHKKCATVVGDVIGKYHPHGDQAVYLALVRMGQDFSVRHVLIDKHGNFGSPSDEPAAYRYTECRLSTLATHLLANIDENTVDLVPNYDGSTEEPSVLPARFPNLLVNGSQGIAVGMATNIPPHNLGEVIDGTIHLIDHPDATVDDLMNFVKGPDFPTGGIIMGRAGILDAYRTGRGSVKLRAKAEIVEGPRGPQIVVTEIPYQTSVEQIEEKAADLVNTRAIEGIRAIRNESAKGVTRLVFELKRDAPALVILNNLYKHTPMQTSFAVNTVALVDGVPRTLTLRDALAYYVDHQVEVITRRSEYRLAKARDRAHIVEGLLKAIDMIDAVIAAIRASDDRAAAKAALMAAPFEFTEPQSEYILDMTLSRLTRLGRTNLEEELANLRSTIAELEAILGDDAVLRGVIKDELIEIRDQFATPRLTPIEFDPGDLDVEDLIDDEELVVMMTASGNIKTVAADAFRTQGRGGRGVAGTKLKDEDVVTDIVHTTAHAYLLMFSNLGRVYRLKAHQIPMMERTARGTALVNLLQLQPGEQIQALIDTRDYETNRYLVFVTRDGIVKKTRFNEYDSSRQTGLIAIGLRDGDELVRVLPANDGDDLLMVSQLGQGIRFAEADVRPMGRTASGVRGMKLRPGDRVVSADIVVPGHHLLTITEAGFGKRTSPEQFNRQGRAGQGVRAMRLHADKGMVVAALMVSDDDEVFVVNDSGVTIRVAAADVSVQGRDATGVRIMNLDDETRVVAAARVVVNDDDRSVEDGSEPALEG